MRGHALDRPEMDGAHLTLYLDEQRLQEFELRAGQPFGGRFELPAGLADRAGLDARFVADDYVYVGPALQHCVSAELEFVGLEPR